MATTQTQAPTDKSQLDQKSQVTPKEPDQSVYIADKDMIKTYPVSMSNDEIDFDLHTTVRSKTPEDYYVNFLPLNEVQRAWNYIEVNGGHLLKEAAETTPGQAGLKATASALKYEGEFVSPAMKLIASDPAYALGFTKEENNPENVANTYKPWVDLWRESTVGGAVTGYSDKALVNQPLPIAAIPWFFAEFVPDQLLEFGTKASGWIGAYGVEKFGPPLINEALSKLPKSAREILLKDIFAGEKSLYPDFETLGIPPNSKTSQVVDAYKKGAQVTHPDIGGDPEEFIKLKTAYENILKSRNGWMDKLFDIFRVQEESAATQAPRGIKGILADQRGFSMIPTSGDMVKVGKEVGKVLKVSGQIAIVNIAGKPVEVALDKLSIIPKSKTSAVNTENLSISDNSKEKLAEATSALGSDLENQKGNPLTHEEVIAKSKEAEIITKGVSREATLEFQASLLKTRQHLAALAEENELTPEFLDALKVMSDLGTDIARNLESFKIDAMPEYASVKVKVIKDLIKLGQASEDILKAAKGVDFKDEQSVAKFYRKFVKPTIPEMLDEFVYMNILSSPLTHITNTFSNVLQLAGLNPLTKLASGAVDIAASNMTGKERQHYISEVPDFYKGAINAVPKAFDLAVNAMKGKKNLERPDLKHLPTLSKLVDFGTLKVGKYFIRALEASDVFFRTMIEAGEIEALSKALGHPPDPKEMAAIQKEATKRADYYVFRNKPDADNKSGQGDFLSAIDQMTNAIYRLRAVPGMKWFVRFVQTPMNILKQGIEYSPAGIATLPGSKDKTEQAGKTIIGSLVFAGGAWLAANNLTTWASPTNEKEKNEFYAAGLQPYSVRVGDKWVSYSKIGPLAYPLAMSAALHYYSKESPNALSDSEMDKIVDGLTGIMKFFSDQSYMQGLGDLVRFASGEKSKAIASIPSQLVPLSSLQGWVNNIIDPLQRKAESGLSIDSVVDNMQMKMVGMSKYVPSQIDYEEAPVKKQMRGINAVSPVRVSKVNAPALADYKESVKDKQELNKLKKDAEK